MVEICKIKKKSKFGMIAFDEVSIDQGLVWSKNNALIGFAGNIDSNLSCATDVLQFMFKTLEEDSMSFPLAFFLTKGLN